MIAPAIRPIPTCKSDQENLTVRLRCREVATLLLALPIEFWNIVVFLGVVVGLWPLCWFEDEPHAGLWVAPETRSSE